MSSVCILTDSTAQFPQPVFPGKAFVRILPLNLKINDRVYTDSKNVKLSSFPAGNKAGQLPRLELPDQSVLQDLFVQLAREFNYVIAILASEKLCPLYQIAMQAMESLDYRINLQIINSQNVSIGLGYLVQIAADLISQGASSLDAERLIRGLIPHQYALICTPGLSYLHASGYLDHAQATVGEMLNILPIFTLEEGRLKPVEKVRGFRQAIDYFQEFLDEFEKFHYISLVQGYPSMNPESRLLRQFVQETFPNTQFSEHTLSSPVATFFGPRLLSLFVSEKI